jgi:predicted O-methyltransferase YrrM
MSYWKSDWPLTTRLRVTKNRLRASVKRIIGGPSDHTRLPVDLEREVRAVLPAIEGWCTENKGCRMARHVLEIDAGTLVELGVYGGRSAIAMALACRHKKSGIVYSVDTWAADSSLAGTQLPEDITWWSKADLERIYRGFLATLIDLKLTSYVVPLRMSSATAARLFGLGEVDMLHQDSNHSPETTCAEVERWWPLLRGGGYWVFDDVDKPGTADAYAMLVERGARVESNNGLWAVFQKPSAAPA